MQARVIGALAYCAGWCARRNRKELDARRHKSTCVLCGERPRCIATHFDSCFAEHCPTSTIVEAEPLQAPRTVQGWFFGSCRLPPCAASLFSDSLSVPERLACACASQRLNEFLTNDGEWNNAACLDWHAFLKTAVGLPDGNCSCGLSEPRRTTSVSPKMKAVGLWRMQALDTVTLELKSLTGKTYKIQCRGVPDGEGARAPVLPHVTVGHLGYIYHSLDGCRLEEQRFIYKGSKQLLHNTASLGAYTWEAFTCGRVLHLDFLLRMSTGACSQGVHDRCAAVPIEWRCCYRGEWQSLA